MANKRVVIAGNQGTGILKLIALALMFCDHAGKMVFANNMDMRLLGRVAFPLYAWCLVVGANYTRSMGFYILRMLMMYAISQPLYMVALNHGWNEPNIFLTLAVGLTGIWGLKRQKWLSQIWAPILAICTAVLLHVDYGWMGVLLMMLLWAVRDSRPGMTAVMIVFCLLWGANSSTVNQLFGFSIAWLHQTPVLSTVLPRVTLQMFAVLALPLMLIRMPAKVRLPMWLGYGIYPLHLVALIIMEGQMLPGGWTNVNARFTGLVMNPVLQFSLLELVQSGVIEPIKNLLP